ncbi:MAG: hypothetical protein ACFFCQ_10515 [Promethearchaeota archaeon]
MSEAYVGTFQTWKAMVKVLAKEGGKEAKRDEDRGIIAALLVLAAEMSKQTQ